MNLRPLVLGQARLDLQATLHCGQVFHWTPFEEGHLGALGHDAVHLKHHRESNTLFFAGTEAITVRRYLGLQGDLERVLPTFPAADPHLTAALAWTPGLRVCRQPEWECLATFITSSLKQVPHIRRISLTLRERFGRPCQIGEVTIYAYPSPQCLAEAGESELRACGLGYRAKSLALAAERVACGEFALDLDGLTDDEARARLCELHGVGEKIANCVLLFAYGRFSAFPIDVWVERILRHFYAPRGKKKNWPRREMQAFAARHFGPYAGYAQQYLFHYARHHDKVLFGAR